MPTGRPPSATIMEPMLCSCMVCRMSRRGVSGGRVIGGRRMMADSGLDMDCCSLLVWAYCAWMICLLCSSRLAMRRVQKSWNAGERCRKWLKSAAESS